VVPGFRVGGDSGALWALNRLYQITDDFVGKVEPMLCNAINFNFDLSSGRTSGLEFVGKNAYTLLVEPVAVGEEASNVK
jgi:hypothetical protein